MLLMQMLLVTTSSTPRNFLQQTEITPEVSICTFNPLCQTTFKHLEANVKHLRGMGLATVVNNDLLVSLFATSVDCEAT